MLRPYALLFYAHILWVLLVIQRCLPRAKLSEPHVCQQPGGAGGTPGDSWTSAVFGQGAMAADIRRPCTIVASDVGQAGHARCRHPVSFSILVYL